MFVSREACSNCNTTVVTSPARQVLSLLVCYCAFGLSLKRVARTLCVSMRSHVSISASANTIETRTNIRLQTTPTTKTGASPFPPELRCVPLFSCNTISVKSTLASFIVQLRSRLTMIIMETISHRERLPTLASIFFSCIVRIQSQMP